MKQAIDYCRKDGQYEEFGDIPLEQTQAATERSKDIWFETKELAQAGKLDDIEPEKYIKYYPTLKKIRSDARLARSRKTLEWKEGSPPNIWMFGKPGVGKSSKARRDFPGAYLKMPQNKWWQGYDDEDVVIIDDLR